MAEAFLQVLLDSLSSLIQKEIVLIIGADKEMKKLSSILTTIQAVLEDAEDKQYESKPIQNWLSKLNDLAYEIEDMLDECLIEVSKLEKKNNKFRSLKKIPVRRKIGGMIKEMTEKLNDVAAERNNFHLREVSIERHANVVGSGRHSQRETSSVPNDPGDVYGRDEEKEKIVDILVNHVKESRQLSVLPIIGLGGLGKTTLAQIVYDDQRIKEHFDTKLWVCVSDDFDLKTLVKAMTESATGSGSASDLMHLDALVCRLRELLNQKRYLLILDDVWNEDQEKWAALKNILACGSKGASVVATTRLKMVADIVGTLPAHCLKELSEEHCWLLFKQRAFGQEVEDHSNLEPIGRQIVKKCAGVPLAARALGGLLRFKRREKEWIYIKESEILDLPQEQTSILPALRLSYRHLSVVLRRCFAYCAVFPKASLIEKDELIFLWMAHGCISSNGVQEVEDIGHGVCNELVLRSLLQLRVGYGGKTFLTMHDLVHDLALSIMENQVPGAHAKSSSPRRSNNKIRQVRLSERLMISPTSIQLQVPPLTPMMEFSHLRMITASGRDTKPLPSSIGKLKQLRYLNLSFSLIQTLPDEFCGLKNLQILNLDWCYKLVSLPKNLRGMNNLRHLLLEECASLSQMPSKIGELTSLKTLSMFVVGDKIGNQLGELECLNLGGKLEIRHLERVKNHRDAKKANLGEKPNLRELVLKWDGNNASGSRQMLDKMVLEALEPHQNIETLEIFGFKGSAFPVWMGNSTMANVIEIDIDSCPNCLHLPPLGVLPRLKKLILGRLDMIDVIAENDIQGGNQFPSLEKLHLWSLPNLKGLLKEDVREMFPNLQELSIHECPSLRLPPLPSLKILEVRECTHSTLSSFSKLDDLTSLELQLDKNTATCIPNEAMESLSNLNNLRIQNAHENILPMECIRCLKALTSLKIKMRGAVACLPGEWFQHLTNLEHLHIFSCEDLAELPEGIKYLHSLKTLQLHDLPKLACLTEGLQHVHSLEHIELFNLNQLTSLPDWISNFMSLRTFSIQKCPRIASFPSTTREMTNLQTLSIFDCPRITSLPSSIRGMANLHITVLPAPPPPPPLPPSLLPPSVPPSRTCLNICGL